MARPFMTDEAKRSTYIKIRVRPVVRSRLNAYALAVGKSATELLEGYILSLPPVPIRSDVPTTISKIRRK